MKNIPTYTESEIIDSLSRSGYLLEIEISKKLTELGFFVETSQSVEDKMTGKSREIDIVAEFYDWEKPKNIHSARAKIEYVFEVKNNNYPLVLMGELDHNPRIDIYEGIKEFSRTNIGYFHSRTSFYEKLVGERDPTIFSQYCSFERKKNENKELMALHPENIHSGLAKIIQYADEYQKRNEEFESNSAGEVRHYLHGLCLPVLLINENLFELRAGVLEKVESSILRINYTEESYKKSALIYVVTKNGLEEFIANTLSVEAFVENELVAQLNEKL